MTMNIITGTKNTTVTAAKAVAKGTVFVVDSVEHGVDKATDKVCYGTVKTGEVVVKPFKAVRTSVKAHRLAHGDRMVERGIKRDERKANKRAAQEAQARDEAVNTLNA